MAHRWQNLILFSVLAGSLIACSKSDNNNNNSASAGDYLASYEANDGCTTGRQVFTATSEDDIRTKFCDGLKDQKLNKNCAVAQREQAFKVAQCQGAWPHTATTGSLSTSNKQYAFAKDGCSTGNHLFVASSDKVASKMMCQALLDDELNRNCAKDQRAELAKKNNCAEEAPAANKTKGKEDAGSADGAAKPSPSQNPDSPSEQTVSWSELDSEEFTCGGSVCDSAQQYCLKSFSISKAQTTATCQPLPKTCMQSQEAETCLRQDAIESFKGKNSCEGGIAIQKNKDRVSVRCSIAKSNMFMIQPKRPLTRP